MNSKVSEHPHPESAPDSLRQPGIRNRAGPSMASSGFLLSDFILAPSAPPCAAARLLLTCPASRRVEGSMETWQGLFWPTDISF